MALSREQNLIKGISLPYTVARGCQGRSEGGSGVMLDTGFDASVSQPSPLCAIGRESNARALTRRGYTIAPEYAHSCT